MSDATRRWIVAGLVGIAALAAIDYYGGRKSQRRARVVSRRDLQQTENTRGIYFLRLRLDDGESIEIEVPNDTEFRPDAEVMLTEVRGRLFGRRSYRFQHYLP